MLSYSKNKKLKIKLQNKIYLDTDCLPPIRRAINCRGVTPVTSPFVFAIQGNEPSPKL